jgi:hypothetical protein
LFFLIIQYYVMRSLTLTRVRVRLPDLFLVWTIPCDMQGHIIRASASECWNANQALTLCSTLGCSFDPSCPPVLSISALLTPTWQKIKSLGEGEEESLKELKQLTQCVSQCKIGLRKEIFLPLKRYTKHLKFLAAH